MTIPEFVHALPPRRITRYAAELGDSLQVVVLSWMLQKGKQEVPDFALDEHCLSAYDVALAWLLGTPHPAISDHLKGLYIMGGAGSGKTTLVHLLRIMAAGLGVERPFFDAENKRYEYRPLLWSCEQHAIATAQHYAETGEYQGLHNRVLHIGDLGAEPEETLHWGTRTKPLSDLICMRSDQGYYDAPMIITSNYHPEDLRPRYGDRCVSRLLGDCILIELGGRDRRQA